MPVIESHLDSRSQSYRDNREQMKTLLALIPPCRARFPLHREAVQRARSVLHEFPVSPFSLKGKESNRRRM